MPMQSKEISAARFLSLCFLLIGCLCTTTPYADALDRLPNWADESDAYMARGLNTSGAIAHIRDGTYSASELEKFVGLSNLSDTHDATEGDPLWTAYQMYQRLNGIHQTAADSWYTRSQNLANFFANNYVGGSAWTDDASFNHDHLYGWGLCNWASGENDTTAIATIDEIVRRMASWNQSQFVVDPGDSIFGVGTGGRRWARQLRFAVCAAEISPTTANLDWRDKVIDIVMQAREWDPTYKMYWLGSGPTNHSSRLGSGAYENGSRIAINFHMGIWMEALWQAWQALDAENDPRAASVRQRLIDMATFFRDIPLDSSGFLRLHLGYNIDSGEPINAGGTGSPTGVYSISPINGLVFAYKLTGQVSYLDRAWTLYENWQRTSSGNVDSIEHYVDSEIASATGFQFLANNKGELQYVYALFENGGNPAVVGSAEAPEPTTTPKPPTLVSDTTDPVATVALAASPSVIDSGQTTTLTWDSANVSDCVASGGWSGSRASSGSEVTDALSSDTQFDLTCSTGSGSLSDSVLVNVDEPVSSDTGQPSWLTNANDRTWIDMRVAVGASTFKDNDPLKTFPNWDLGQNLSGPDYHRALIDNWNGGIAREDFLVIGLAGGHFGSPQNTVFEFGPFSSETPDWNWYGTNTDRYEIPSHGGSPDPTISSWSNEEGKAYYSDGRPTSDHVYDHVCYIPDLGNGVGRVLFRPYVVTAFDDVGGRSFRDVASFKFHSDSNVGGTYERQGTYPDFPGSLGPGGVTEYDPVSRQVWVISTGSGDPPRVDSFDPVTKTWTRHASSVAGSFGNDTDGGSLDPDRRIMILHANGDGLLVVDLSSGREGDSVFIDSYSGALATQGNIGIEYEPVGRKFVGYDGGATLYTLEPPSDYRRSDGSLNGAATWTWRSVANNSGGATPSQAPANGTYGRFRYIPSIRAFAAINDDDDAMYVYKVPASGL